MTQQHQKGKLTGVAHLSFSLYVCVSLSLCLCVCVCADERGEISEGKGGVTVGQGLLCGI